MFYKHLIFWKNKIYFKSRSPSSIPHPHAKDKGIDLASITAGSKPLSTDPTPPAIPAPASHYYSNFSKNQPSTQGIKFAYTLYKFRIIITKLKYINDNLFFSYNI